MNFMMKQLTKHRKNNKGFTLVELIIVIAIIAILAAVLAPQYIKYVEKSRAATDVDTVGVVAQAINVLLADGTITAAETFTWDTNGTGATGTLTSNGSHADEVATITGTVKAPKSAKAKQADVTFTVTFAADGTPSMVVAPATYQDWAK